MARLTSRGRWTETRPAGFTDEEDLKGVRPWHAEIHVYAACLLECGKPPVVVYPYLIDEALRWNQTVDRWWTEHVYQHVAKSCDYLMGDPRQEAYRFRLRFVRWLDGKEPI